MIGKILKMMIFAKEKGQIGGDGIDQMDEFRLTLLFNVIQVCGEGVHIQKADTLRQAIVDKIFLGIVQIDSAKS